MSSLNGLNGFVLNGVSENDQSGRSVSAAGDINGDGIDDLIIGAYFADSNESASGASYVVFGEAIVDVAISKTNGVGFADPLDTLTYTIIASNLAATEIPNVTIVDILPVTLDNANATWNCAPSGGATCTANGLGDINDIVSLPGFSQVTYTLMADVLATEAETIINTASATLPASMTLSLIHI